MLSRHTTFLRLLGACVLVLASATVVHAADAWPTRPIRVIVPAGAGGNLDLTMRVLGEKMGEILGQPIVVENRAGGNSLLGTRLAAAAPADGYTLLAISNTFTISPSVMNSPGYDPVKDFVGIGLMNRVPELMVTSASSPDKTMRDFVARAKAQPGQLSYASGGTGTTTHVLAAMFMQQAGLKVLHVPYKGNAPAIPDIVSGQVQVIFDPINTSGPLVRDGKLRALGYTGIKRSPLFPNIPTIAEQGIPDFDFAIYTALVAPANTPKDVVAKLHAALMKVTASPEMRERFSKDGTELITGQSLEDFNAFLRQELQNYTKLVETAGIPKE